MMENTTNAVSAISFNINGIKVNATFAQKSGGTVERVKQILANSFAMREAGWDNNTKAVTTWP